MKEYRNTNYFVDEQGNVHGKRKTLKPCMNKKGYMAVYLSHEREKLTRLVHRLVAELFIPNPEDKPEVNHIDGDKTNNCVGNLEWVTAKENKEHAMKVLGKGYGETHSQATLTEEQVRQVCTMIQDGYRTVDIHRKLNISLDKIRSVKKGTAWKHVACDYIFPKGKSDHGISDQTFLWICYQLQDGKTYPQIKELYHGKDKLNPQIVSCIRRRKTRPHLSKDFKF